MVSYIECDDLSVGYDGRAVCEHITFSAGPGMLVCIVGENGAGKSTLVKTLLGLLPPVSGRIALGGGLGPGEVGYLPQQSEMQRDFPASVWEVVLSGRLSKLGARPFYRPSDREAAVESLARVGASDLVCRPYGSLSGGQQQRVLISRALCASARLLVLDEPVTGLDPDATAGLYRLLDELRGDGVAVLMISHDLGEALKHATHVLRIGGDAPWFGPVGSFSGEVA